MKDSAIATTTTQTPVKHRHVTNGLLLLAVLVTSCAQVEPGSDYARARGLVEASTGASEVFDPESAALSEQDIELILADEPARPDARRVGNECRSRWPPDH